MHYDFSICCIFTSHSLVTVPKAIDASVFKFHSSSPRCLAPISQPTLRVCNPWALTPSHVCPPLSTFRYRWLVLTAYRLPIIRIHSQLSFYSISSCYTTLPKVGTPQSPTLLPCDFLRLGLSRVACFQMLLLTNQSQSQS
jgi:hypothetical protein